MVRIDIVKLSRDFKLLVAVVSIPLLYVVFYNLLDQVLGLRGILLSVASLLMGCLPAFFIGKQFFSSYQKDVNQTRYRLAPLLVALFLSLFILLASGIYALSCVVFRECGTSQFIQAVLWPIHFLR